MNIRKRSKFNLHDNLFFLGELGERTPFKVAEIMFCVSVVGVEIVYFDTKGNARRECELFKGEQDGLLR